jgi:hypothetical protein
MIVTDPYSAETTLTEIDSPGTVTALFEDLLTVEDPFSAITQLVGVNSSGTVTALFEDIPGTITINVPPASSSPVAYVPEVSACTQNDFAIGLKNDLNNIFFNSQEFAVSARYIHRLNTQTPQIYAVIFDDPHATMKAGDGEYSSIRPQFQIAQHKLKYAISKKDEVTICGIKYIVDEYMTDGVGVVTVYLNVRK